MQHDIQIQPRAAHNNPIDALAVALERALASDDLGAARIAYAQTSVRFECGDAGAGVTLLLEDGVPRLVDDAGAVPPEIVIHLGQEQCGELARGVLPIPALVARGDVTTSGPVRRYLEVDPVLRAMLARAAGTGNGELAERARAGGERWTGAIDPALLALETRGVVKRFGSNVVLDGMDMTVPEGVISVILGPSGTGKSVLLQHVLGLLEPDAGEVLVRGRSLRTMSRREQLELRTEIGVLFQDGALFSAMNVFDNVAFPLRQHTDLTEVEVRDVVLRRLEAVGLRDAVEAYPAGLSGGMKKRAGLARALVMEPNMLLCDEPDSGLDPVRTALLGELLADQHAEMGGTMIVVTHNIELAKNIAEHISVVWRGRVLESGLRDDILQSDTPFVQQFLDGRTVGPLGMDA